MMCDRYRRSRNERICQDSTPRWISLHGPELFSVGQHALAIADVWTIDGNHLADSNRRHATQRVDRPARRRRVGIARVQVFSTLEEVQKRGQWHHSLPRPLPNQLDTRVTCRRIVDKAIASPAAHERMTGKYLLGVCWIWLLGRSDESFGFA